jgi:hypothetical protein
MANSICNIQKLILDQNLELSFKRSHIKFKISQGLQFAVRNISTSNMSKCIKVKGEKRKE